MSDTPKLCSVKGCPRPSRAKGMCASHYRRASRGTPVEGPIREEGMDARYDLRLSSDLLAQLQAQAEAKGVELAALMRSDLAAAAKRRSK